MKSFSRRHFLTVATLFGILGPALIPPSATADTPKPIHFRRIAILGNSITLHSPKPDIGWTSNWGMAASSEAADYAHQFQKAIAAIQGTQPELYVKNIAPFEKSHASFNITPILEGVAAFNPDLVILAIGENMAPPKDETESEQITLSVLKLLDGLKKGRERTLLIRGSFWPAPAKDVALAKAAQRASVRFIDIAHLGKDPSHLAHAERQFQNIGVGNHPGDKGMKAIADQLVKALQ
jgi:hypothetical protein